MSRYDTNIKNKERTCWKGKKSSIIHEVKIDFFTNYGLI